MVFKQAEFKHILTVDSPHSCTDEFVLLLSISSPDSLPTAHVLPETSLICSTLSLKHPARSLGAFMAFLSFSKLNYLLPWPSCQAVPTGRPLLTGWS